MNKLYAVFLTMLLGTLMVIAPTTQVLAGNQVRQCAPQVKNGKLLIRFRLDSRRTSDGFIPVVDSRRTSVPTLRNFTVGAKDFDLFKQKGKESFIGNVVDNNIRLRRYIFTSKTNNWFVEVGGCKYRSIQVHILDRRERHRMVAAFNSDQSIASISGTLYGVGKHPPVASTPTGPTKPAGRPSLRDVLKGIAGF